MTNAREEKSARSRICAHRQDEDAAERARKSESVAQRQEMPPYELEVRLKLEVDEKAIGISFGRKEAGNNWEDEGG
eukprot:603784-Pleurochrysis_carterae.AAC.2